MVDVLLLRWFCIASGRLFSSAKRTKTVEIDFTVSAKPLANSDKIANNEGKLVNVNCHPYFLDQTPISKLYLRDWLSNYFATINFDATKPDKVKLSRTEPGVPTESEQLQDDFLNKTRSLANPQAIPQQFKIQSVDLSTSIYIAADISGGATPNVLGNGSVFILPINGLSLDYNPDYSHKIDIALSMCDNSGQDECNAKQAPSVLTPQLDDQCHLYARLAPILSGMSPPKDVQTQADIDNHRKEPNPYHCSKSGLYPGRFVDKNGVPYPDLPIGPPIVPVISPSASKR